MNRGYSTDYYWSDYHMGIVNTYNIGSIKFHKEFFEKVLDGKSENILLFVKKFSKFFFGETIQTNEDEILEKNERIWIPFRVSLDFHISDQRNYKNLNNFFNMADVDEMVLNEELIPTNEIFYRWKQNEELFVIFSFFEEEIDAERLTYYAQMIKFNNLSAFRVIEEEYTIKNLIRLGFYEENELYNLDEMTYEDLLEHYKSYSVDSSKVTKESFELGKEEIGYSFIIYDNLKSHIFDGTFEE